MDGILFDDHLQRLQSIHNKGVHANYKEDLLPMGFVFDRLKSAGRFAEVKEALLSYKAVHGDMKVPASYVIGEDDDGYPGNVRGLKLGSVVQ